jgi:LacI family transcriptional regulator
MGQKTSNRIALLLGKELGYCRRVLAGVLSYADSHKLQWMFHHAPPDVRVLPALERWQPDGVILYRWDRGIVERLHELGVKIVSVGDTPPDLTIPCFDVDNEAVGRVAADYFLGLGHRFFAYYGSRSIQSSINREKGFRARLESLGYPVSSLNADSLASSPFGQDWNYIDRGTERWLKQLPKPTGVLASNDIPAKLLCEACWQLGIQVPDEISILGVDNDVSECQMSVPALSSIEVPAEQIGSEAAAYLFRLLEANGEMKCSAKFLPPLGVIARRSTDCRATCDERLRDILNFIEETVEQGTTVLDVCRYSGLNRRSVERLFKSELDSTVFQRIQEVRITRAKRLLLETRMTMDEIAGQSGFGNTRRLDRVFRQVEGVLPSAYRSEV